LFPKGLQNNIQHENQSPGFVCYISVEMPSDHTSMSVSSLFLIYQSYNHYQVHAFERGGIKTVAVNEDSPDDPAYREVCFYRKFMLILIANVQFGLCIRTNMIFPGNITIVSNIEIEFGGLTHCSCTFLLALLKRVLSL
jgi:hypothetical protein